MKARILKKLLARTGKKGVLRICSAEGRTVASGSSGDVKFALRLPGEEDTDFTANMPADLLAVAVKDMDDTDDVTFNAKSKFVELVTSSRNVFLPSKPDIGPPENWGKPETSTVISGPVFLEAIERCLPFAKENIGTRPYSGLGIDFTDSATIFGATNMHILAQLKYTPVPGATGKVSIPTNIAQKALSVFRGYKGDLSVYTADKRTGIFCEAAFVQEPVERPFPDLDRVIANYKKTDRSLHLGAADVKAALKYLRGVKGPRDMSVSLALGEDGMKINDGVSVGEYHGKPFNMFVAKLYLTVLLKSEDDLDLTFIEDKSSRDCPCGIIRAEGAGSVYVVVGMEE